MKTSSSNFPLVSIIAVNYNQPSVTEAMLLSVCQITYPAYEVIVVDNGSGNDELGRVMEKFSRFRYIRSEINLGFAGGNNLAMQHASGEYILFLNNDTEVDRGFLEPLVSRLKSSESIGMVSPKIRFYNQPEIIQYAGSTNLNTFTLRNRLIGWNEKDTGQYDQPGPTQFGHGAAMMVPRKIIEEVGLMSEIYFLYYEEIDWCTRIKKAGYSIWFVPQSLVLHKESVSTGKMSGLKIYYLTRNRLVYARRNLKGFPLFISLLYLYLVAGPKNLIQHILAGNFRLILPFIQAHTWHLRHLSKKHTENI